MSIILPDLLIQKKRRSKRQESSRADLVNSNEEDTRLLLANGFNVVSLIVDYHYIAQVILN